MHAVNRVERSKIRIASDEVTYNLHIILRYELERDMFADKIGLDELPQVWNQKYADLGVKVKMILASCRTRIGQAGCMGIFNGLGNIYSGQIIKP